MIKLSRRLMASASFVSAGSRVADVGCDHGYTSIYLAEQGIAAHCIAMDIREGPLSKAEDNIKRSGCQEKIETRLSDGLKQLSAGEVDTVLISGMGGGLIQKILTDSGEVTASLKELVLQPQSEPEQVRRLLHRIGFEIKEETMLNEDGKYYVSIHALKTTEGKPQPYEQEHEYLFGKTLLGKKDECLWEYLKDRQKKYLEILRVMKEHGKTPADRDYQEIEKKRSEIRKALECYKGEDYEVSGNHQHVGRTCAAEVCTGMG
jgi:tRNA (adenine22-N1)-methyltransferase